MRRKVPINRFRARADLKEMGIVDWPIGPRRRLVSALAGLLRPHMPALFAQTDIAKWSSDLRAVDSGLSDSEEDSS